MDDKQVLASFQFLSDFHLEFRDHDVREWPEIKRVAPILVLAGDIGKVHQNIYGNFIGYVSLLFDHVLLVPGNHEHYQPSTPMHTIEDCLDILRGLAKKFENVYLLHMNYFDFNGVRFLGTTLWSQVPEIARSDVQYSLNDYNSIYKAKKDISLSPWSKLNWVKPTVDDTNKWHKQQLNWLQTQLKKSTIPTVVITHHAPSPYHINEEYRPEDPINRAYYTDLEYMMERPMVVWISGHTHSYRSFYLGKDVLCAVNCKGYPHQNIKGYNPNRVIQVYQDRAVEKTNIQ
jgi:predicted phosphodiesterase